MPWKWYNSKVVEILDLGPSTKQFTIEVDSEEILDFVPGQFITMDLPIHDKRTKRWRSYSIANNPDQSNRLELCIVNLEGGLASEYLFSEVRTGSNIRFKGPSGGFTLPASPLPELVMVCTGTGIAPFRSMLQDLHVSTGIDSPIHLIFGTRYKDGILYRDEMQQLAEAHPNFKYSVALSRDQDWSGHRGYVHQIYQSDYKSNDGKRLFYLCGWSNMVDEAVATLMMDMGYDRSQIRYELYG